jgi:hypothetical protein
MPTCARLNRPAFGRMWASAPTGRRFTNTPCSAGYQPAHCGTGRQIAGAAGVCVFCDCLGALRPVTLSVSAFGAASSPRGGAKSALKPARQGTVLCLRSDTEPSPVCCGARTYLEKSCVRMRTYVPIFVRMYVRTYVLSCLEKKEGYPTTQPDPYRPGSTKSSPKN